MSEFITLVLLAAAVTGLIAWRLALWRRRRVEQQQAARLRDWLAGRGWQPVAADDDALDRASLVLHRLGVGPVVQEAFASPADPGVLVCRVRFLHHDTGKGQLLLAALPASAELPDCALLKLSAAHGPLRRQFEDGVRRIYLRDWIKHQAPGLPADAPVTVYGHRHLELTDALREVAARITGGPDAFLVRGARWLLVRGVSLLRDPLGEQEAAVLLDLIGRLRGMSADAG